MITNVVNSLNTIFRIRNVQNKIDHTFIDNERHMKQVCTLLEIKI